MSAIATLPIFSVELGGDLLPQTDLLTVEDVIISQKLSAPSMCEVLFLHPERELVRCGQSLRIYLGQQKQMVFQGDVTAVEHEYDAGGRKMRVRAYDRLARLRKQFSVKAHVQIGLKELVTELVRDLGITVEGSADTPLWQRFIQYRQSHLDFVLDLADRAGLYLTLRGPSGSFARHQQERGMRLRIGAGMGPIPCEPERRQSFQPARGNEKERVLRRRSLPADVDAGSHPRSVSRDGHRPG